MILDTQDTWKPTKRYHAKRIRKAGKPVISKMVNASDMIARNAVARREPSHAIQCRKLFNHINRLLAEILKVEKSGLVKAKRKRALLAENSVKLRFHYELACQSNASGLDDIKAMVDRLKG